MTPPASAIADVLALWGNDGWLTPPLAPLVPALVPTVARARTLRIASAATGPGLAPLYDVLSADLTGCAIVLGSAHAVGAAVWGEILSTAAAARNAAAVLVDGAARDRPDVVACGVPLYARDERLVGPAGRAQVVAVDAVVSIDDAAVTPDDVVVVDATGCVRVEARMWSEVLDASLLYAAAEADVVRAIAGGEPLSSAYLIKKSVVDDLRRREAGTREVMAGPV